MDKCKQVNEKVAVSEESKSVAGGLRRGKTEKELDCRSNFCFKS